MRNISKLLKELATDWKNNNFFRAKIKLTIYYSTIIFFVVLGYSILLHSLFTVHIRVRAENKNISFLTDVKNDFLEGTKNGLLDIIFLLDTISIFFSVVLGYYFAKKTINPLEESYLKQKRIISDMAHELKLPLSVVKTGIQSLSIKETVNIEDYEDLNEDIITEVDRLSNMINDILFLEKTENMLDISFRNINLSELLKKEIDFMKNYAKDFYIDIKTNIAEHIYISGDEQSIKKMIDNLIKNAVDYNKSGGSVFVDLDREGSYAKLCITDDGIGIPSSDIKKIFERFYKVDSSRSMYKGGSGLGLSIVKDIVEKHHGSISVNSIENEGSKFTVLIPIV
jgi:signal transduction histidine kinase